MSQTNVWAIKNPDKYIVVDENNKPMAFEEDQFCYVPSMGRRVGRPSSFKLESYSKEEAMRLIKKSHEYREKNNFSYTELYLMPI
jgi:hypothetical protein